MKATKLFRDFFESEKSAGITLMLCTIVSLIISNSNWTDSYHALFQHAIAGHSLEHWINDGLMTIFFLLIGLELEREIYIGELSSLKDAMLPIFGALGGMIVPVAIYLFFNYGTSTQSGAGIPMATDIAFALGVLSLLGNRVPTSLKIFLTALAVIDDLGAILVIAIFYSKTLVWHHLIISLSIFALLLVFNRMKIRNLIPYLIGGVAMWYYMLQSGIHPTISGVLLAFAIPFGNGDEKSTSFILQKFLHKPVAFILLPIFALANTAVHINANMLHSFTDNFSLGIFCGLVIGKPLGIFLFSFIAVLFGFCQLPKELNWKIIFGVSLLGGIGFTMSIFIALLGFTNDNLIMNAKLIILVSSFVSAIIGLGLLQVFLRNEVAEELEST